MNVTLMIEDQTLVTVTLSPEALDAVRFKFNPSGLQPVEQLKAAAALLYQLNMDTQARNPDAGREAAVAKTNLQTASMWGVLAATKGL
jgi:hypothetical protein